MSIMNIAVIGLGYWGKNHVRIVNNSQHNLSAICDLNIKMLEKYSYLKCNKYTNYIEMFEQEKLDGVIIVTVAKTHLKIILDALKYNLKIFVEKPYTLNTNETKQIEKIFNDNTKLMVGHTYLFNSSINYIKKYITNKFNNVKTISFEWTSNGVRILDTTPIFDLCVHPLSILFYLFPNKKISNINSIKSSSGYSYFINFKLDDIIVQLNISWSSPGKTRKMIINNENVKIEFDDVNNKTPITISFLNDEYNNVVNTQTYIHSDGNILCPKIENKEPLTEQFENWIKYMNNEIECVSNHIFSTQIIDLCEKIN